MDKEIQIYLLQRELRHHTPFSIEGKKIRGFLFALTKDEVYNTAPVVHLTKDEELEVLKAQVAELLAAAKPAKVLSISDVPGAEAPKQLDGPIPSVTTEDIQHPHAHKPHKK